MARRRSRSAQGAPPEPAPSSRRLRPPAGPRPKPRSDRAARETRRAEAVRSGARPLSRRTCCYARTRCTADVCVPSCAKLGSSSGPPSPATQRPRDARRRPARGQSRACAADLGATALFSRLRRQHYRKGDQAQSHDSTVLAAGEQAEARRHDVRGLPVRRQRKHERRLLLLGRRRDGGEVSTAVADAVRRSKGSIRRNFRPRPRQDSNLRPTA